MSRILLIDGQLFQTPAWHRGMGKYSLELLAALIDLNNETKLWNKIEILLSKSVSHDKDVIRILRKKLPGADLMRISLLPNEIGDHSVPQHNCKVISEYVRALSANGFEVDFFVLSIMQGEIFPTFPASVKCRKILLSYDLIPLMFHETYLSNPITRIEYLTKIQELIKADLFLTISQTVANDLALYLGIDSKKIVNINGGPINHSDRSKAIKKPEHFILMPTGNDLRKNNRNAILGFKKFNQKHNNSYKLIITSFFKKHEVAELMKLSKDVIFTGNISGNELTYLYEKSSALLFPPIYEGLGLPILEALEKYQPVACSDISVFREMSETAFQYFNPYSIDEIAQAIEFAVDQKFVNVQAYDKILKKYTWQHTVTKAVEAIGRAGSTYNETATINLAIFGPDPVHHGVGKLIQANHAELSRKRHIDYYISNPPTKNNHEPRINYLRYISHCTDINPGFKFNPENYEATVYHLDNSEEFVQVLPAALALQGIVVLHSNSLRKLWLSALKHGLIDADRLKLEADIHKISGLGREAAQSYLVSVLANKSAVVVFDTHTKNIVEEAASISNPEIHVVQAKIPVNNLVYTSILPAKNTAYRRLKATKRFVNNENSDMGDYEELSRTRILIADKNSPRLSIFEAMNLGVVPVVPDVANYIDLPNSAVMRYRSKVDLDALLKQTNDNESLLMLSNNCLKLSHEHTQANFANLITKTSEMNNE